MQHSDPHVDGDWDTHSDCDANRDAHTHTHADCNPASCAHADTDDIQLAAPAVRVLLAATGWRVAALWRAMRSRRARLDMGPATREPATEPH